MSEPSEWAGSRRRSSAGPREAAPGIFAFLRGLWQWWPIFAFFGCLFLVCVLIVLLNSGPPPPRVDVVQVNTDFMGGTRYEGKIIEDSETRVRMRLRDGTELEVPRRSIIFIKRDTESRWGGWRTREVEREK